LRIDFFGNQYLRCGFVQGHDKNLALSVSVRPIVFWLTCRHPNQAAFSVNNKYSGATDKGEVLNIFAGSSQLWW
jgi:hypothetical protein